MDFFYITHRKAAPKEGAPASEDEAVFRFKAVYLLYLMIFNLMYLLVWFCDVLCLDLFASLLVLLRFVCFNPAR